MLKLAVIGKDVHKSDSPRMHRFILGKLGAKCEYDAVSIPPAEFSVRAEALFHTYDAFNVTIPFKADIIPFLKETRADATKFGVVNTVLCKERAGYNTDGYGFLLMLENAGISVKGKSVLVLGAGGAGRSCIFKLVEAGAKVSAYEKSAERLAAVHQEIGGFTPLDKIPLAPFDIIVNCTGIGMHDTEGVSPVGEELIALSGAAVDLIYVPKKSEFLRLAEKRGKPIVNGEAMLFYQAYMADCIYLNRQANASEAKAFFQEYTKEAL